jgi:DNA invertase Pin-like site-specific DNA recombinase
MMIEAKHRVAIYLRVSTLDQTTANQERELREVASRMGCEVVKVYRDHGVSGAKGRDERPQFDRLCRDATKREFDAIMAWSVDRLGRSLRIWCTARHPCRGDTGDALIIEVIQTNPP